MSKHLKLAIKGKQRTQRSYPTNVFLGAHAKETLEKIDDTCLTIINFKKYAEELDYRKDKFERLIKISRDITIESKRIIFLLHTIDRESKREAVLQEAERKLENLLSHQCKQIAVELDGEDPYLYHRAFSPGIQEFMESFIYFNYLKTGDFFHWDYYQNKMKYVVDDYNNLSFKDNVKTEIVSQLIKKKEIFTILVPQDFILGLADVSGELMKKCINSLGSGDVESCLETCKFVRQLHTCFLSLGTWGNKEMSHKAFILNQSLLKMEMLCYNIHIRGSEIPKHMLANINVHKTYEDEDDRFYD